MEQAVCREIPLIETRGLKNILKFVMDFCMLWTMFPLPFRTRRHWA